VTPGQEEGNDQFVELYGVGFAPRSTAGVIDALRMLSAHPETRERLRRNCERVSRRDAAASVARLVMEVATSGVGNYR